MCVESFESAVFTEESEGLATLSARPRMTNAALEFSPTKELIEWRNECLACEYSLLQRAMSTG
jgi:hypothetical protein